MSGFWVGNTGIVEFPGQGNHYVIHTILKVETWVIMMFPYQRNRYVNLAFPEVETWIIVIFPRYIQPRITGT